MSAIDDLVKNRSHEELFLDFKRSADNGNGERLYPTDHRHLADAISAFGNSEGGVIVWGLNYRPLKVAAAVAARIGGITRCSRARRPT